MPDILTLPVLTFDLGGSVEDAEGFVAALEGAGFATVPPEENRLWRRAYRLGRRSIIQLGPFEVETDDPHLRRIPAEMRIHPVGVVAVRFALGIGRCQTFDDSYELNERVADWRDVEGERFFRNEKDTDDVLAKVERIQDIARGFVEGRPVVCRRNALNTLQVVEASPDEETVRHWVHEFSRLQGAPVGPGGDVMTSEHLHISRWADAVVCHLGGGQTLAMTSNPSRRSDLISLYERTHVIRFWLKTWIEVLDELGAEDLSGRVLGHEDVRSLSLEHLKVTQLHQHVTGVLAEVDDRNIPSSSVFGRQLTVSFSRMFEIERWKASLVDRLDAAAARSNFIGSVLEREFQLSAHRQNEKLQLLFAGSLAATIMALLPALLALSNPRGPLWPWIWATIAGTVLIWVFTVYLVVRRWKVRVMLSNATRKRR
ncbi:MAG TPA: hypothetical protein VHI71_10315 [Actinomycetota bacterium]|nr:hypothetical protein [Actinomycetota bacterium]